MRDFNRIYPMVDQLRNYWRMNPDMRFGQMLDNLIIKLEFEAGREGYTEDFFNIEDDKMKFLMEKVLMGVHK